MRRARSRELLHLLDGYAFRDLEGELLVVELLVKDEFADVDLQFVLVDGAGDDDAHREVDGADLLKLVVVDDGDDAALVVVDVLLIGQEREASEMDDADSLEHVIALDVEYGEIVVRLFDGVFRTGGRGQDAGVTGEGDVLIRLAGGHKKCIANDAWPKVFKTIFGGRGELVRTDHGAIFWWDEQLEVFPVGDHIERTGAEDGHKEQDAKVGRLAEENVPGEGRNFFDLAFVPTARGGGDIHSGIEGLDRGILSVDALFELLEGGVKQIWRDDHAAHVAGADGEASQERERKEGCQCRERQAPDI